MRIGDEKKIILSPQITVKKKDGPETPKDQVMISAEDNIGKLKKQLAELQKKIGDISLEKAGEAGEMKNLKAINTVESSVISAIGGPLAGVAADYYNTELST
ncbi:MAG: hypothetical protein ABRQ39_17290 [Candidatus Eremiobacterota bacterium]